MFGIKANALASQKLAPPIESALKRVTKKPFGIYVTPQSSPVKPEKFKGYHTGVDFEILPSEKNKEVKGNELILSKDDSKVKVIVIPTNEELVIATDTMEVISSKQN